MSGNSPKIDLPQFPELRAVVISASWHRNICQALVNGAVRGLQDSGVTEIHRQTVAGSFELPLAAQLALDSGFDLAVVVGLVLRGETPHFDYVCQGVTSGIMNLTLSRSKPVGFGVLMCDDLKQASDRAGLPDSKEDKGYDSAVAALSVLANYQSNAG